jgi:hypothetical protein
MLLLPIMPFTEKPFNWGMLIGMLMIAVIIAGIVWFNQYLFSLIPLILNKPWINYILNFIIHTGLWGLIITVSNKNNKKMRHNRSQIA